MIIELRYDASWGCSDADAFMMAVSNIANVSKVEPNQDGVRHFYFANEVYLTEWRIALVRGKISELTVVYPEGQQKFDLDGKSDWWPSKMTIRQEQISRLLAAQRGTNANP